MNQELLERVLQSPRLPSLPTIAIEVIDLVQQRDVNIKRIAHTISHDPALSSKILKTVNSSFYGQAHSISTISHALVILGLNSVKTLALGFSLVPNLKHSGGESFDHVSFWKRSLFTAVAARSLAKQAGLVQHEEVFLGGLLQDLGMLALHQALDGEYHKIVAEAGVHHRRLRPCEQRHLQADHAQIGGVLAQRWNLPDALVAPIRYHEEPEAAPPELAPLVRCVALGNRVADLFITDPTPTAMEAYLQLAKEWLSLSREQAEPLLTSIHQDTVEMRNLFDLPTGPLGNSDEVLSRANEALLQISLQQQKQTSELEQQNRELAEQAVTDSLTGVANRRRFAEYLTDQFVLARDGAGPLSLLFLDTDHFKRFNDTYGHQTGDQVLIEIASTLKRLMPKFSLVARYGGEEFAVVLPGTGRVAAARWAEAVRQSIQNLAIPVEGGPSVAVTVSLGASTYDGRCFDRVEQVVKAADQAMYAAKTAGRNCVRVFAPRPPAKPAPMVGAGA